MADALPNGTIPIYPALVPLTGFVTPALTCQNVLFLKLSLFLRLGNNITCVCKIVLGYVNT